MKITIAGAGRVGTHLAKYLSSEHQDITIIDNDPARLSELDASFNLKVVEGDPNAFATMDEAKVSQSDLFIAVTPYSAENIVACATAKAMGAHFAVARVDKYDYIDPKNEKVVKSLGVDTAVFPEYLASQTILSALDHSWANDWYEFCNGEIIMIGVQVSADAPIAGVELNTISPDNGFHISAVRRNHTTIIPRGDFKTQDKDVLYFTTTSDKIRAVREIAGKRELHVSNVILAGGNLISELTARHGARDFHFTIIEKDQARCRVLAQNCPKADIVCGDAGENDVLIEAGFANADAFVALSEGAAGNILACLSAADGGITKTIAEIEREESIPKAESFGIPTIINKQLIASSFIFQLIVDSEQSISKCLTLPDAGVARMTINGGSFLTSAPVRDLKLPVELTFAGMIRNGKGLLVSGNTHFQPGDFVLVFCLDNSLHKVEKLFKK